MSNAFTAPEKIQRFSRVIYVLLKIGFIAYIVYGGFQIVTLITLTPGFFPALPKIVDLGEFNPAGIPILFWRGTRVYLPVLPYTTVVQAAQNLAQTVFTAVALGFGQRVFRMLREAGSPFRPKVVAGIRKTAIAMLFVGVATGGAGFLAAGITWVLYLVFDYGCTLQDESDTTL